MKHFLVAPIVLLAAVQLSGQSLQQLVRTHEAKLRQIDDLDEQDKLWQKHAGDLTKMLANAKTSAVDRFGARLRLTNTFLFMGKMDKAKANLKALDTGACTALQLVEAAFLASQLRMKDTRKAWVDAALTKKTNFEQRMELALLLMTKLVEIERGEKIFEAELKRQKDDEGRARVLWFRTKAVREREDLPEGAYEQALEQLAKKYPKTRYGSIASDRVEAFKMKPGSHGIPFTIQDTDGQKRTLSGYKGKVLLLYFWTTASRTCERFHTTAAALHKELGNKGLQLLGIALDKDMTKLKKAQTKQGIRWPVALAGGRDADIALRYKAEMVPYILLFGRDGKLVGLNYDVLDKFGTQELQQAVRKAVATN